MRSAEEGDWEPYLRTLRQTGVFRGGSAVGGGMCLRKGCCDTVSHHLIGFIRIETDRVDRARSLLAGYPVFEAGGTVEIRELPRTD